MRLFVGIHAEKGETNHWSCESTRLQDTMFYRANSLAFKWLRHRTICNSPLADFAGSAGDSIQQSIGHPSLAPWRNKLRAIR